MEQLLPLVAIPSFTPMRYYGNPFRPILPGSGFIVLDNWVERLQRAHEQFVGAFAYEARWHTAMLVADFQVRSDIALAQQYGVKYSTVANLPE